MGILTGVIGLPLGYVLILNFGVLGLIITTLTASLPSLVIALNFVKKTYNMTVDWGSSARILLSGLAAGGITYAFISYVSFSSLVELILGVCVFVVILIPALLLTRSITRSDITNLHYMIGGLGKLGGIIDKLLAIVERLMDILRL
jgi:hypothetical protein